MADTNVNGYTVRNTKPLQVRCPVTAPRLCQLGFNAADMMKTSSLRYARCAVSLQIHWMAWTSVG